MSVYHHKGSPFYHYDFQFRGSRFCGSTGCTSRREAEAVERTERERARALQKRSPTNAADLLIDAACVRYFQEVGQHQVCADETFTNLDRLATCPHLEGKALADITDKVVTEVIAWRRGHHRWGRADLGRISPATVNCSTTEVLQKLFTRATKKWGASFDHEPNWREHMPPEPAEHVRELRSEEADAITLATRNDYAPFFAFATSGLRLRECLLKWTEVDWDARLISKKGKRGRIVTAPITDEIEAILRPLIGHHATFVFTYRAQRTRGEYLKGGLYPITFSGAKTQWRRTRARAGVEGFRFHDFRHDLGTKLLRETGNLKLVQRALNHADLKTTTRYAHVLDTEIAEALERVQAAQQSRNKSRSARLKAS